MYASTQNKREWLHVLDHCSAIDLVLREGVEGETYNVGSGIEATIEEIADLVLELTEKPPTLKTIVPDRPGHDRRYLLDATKIRDELGWERDARLARRPGRDGRLVRGKPRVVGAAEEARARSRKPPGAEVTDCTRLKCLTCEPKIQTIYVMSLAWSTAVRLLTVCSVLVALAAGAAWAHPVQSGADGRRGDLRRVRAWLGPRCRDEPVRRVRHGQRRPHARGDPRALLLGDRARSGTDEAGSRAPRRGQAGRDDLVPEAVHRRRRARRDLQACPRCDRPQVRSSSSPRRTGP